MHLHHRNHLHFFTQDFIVQPRYYHKRNSEQEKKYINQEGRSERNFLVGRSSGPRLPDYKFLPKGGPWKLKWPLSQISPLEASFPNLPALKGHPVERVSPGKTKDDPSHHPMRDLSQCHCPTWAKKCGGWRVNTKFPAQPGLSYRSQKWCTGHHSVFSPPECLASRKLWVLKPSFLRLPVIMNKQIPCREAHRKNFAVAKTGSFCGFSDRFHGWVCPFSLIFLDLAHHWPMFL